MAAPGFTLESARPEDVPSLRALIAELARFEELTHLLEVTDDALHRDLFGPRPPVEAWIGWLDGNAVAYAMTFQTYSSFLGRPGLWLEDIYVQPAYRRLGLGKAILRSLAGQAVARGYGRFEWSVLDWNTPAQQFYEAQGATVMPDWRIVRLTGEPLRRFAQESA